MQVTVLAPGRGVEDLLQTLVDHVAVALDGEDDRVGPGPLDPGGQRRGPAVQRLEHLDVEVVREGRVAPDAEHGDRPAGQARARSIASTTARMAIGSPQPGHRWWAPTSISAGVKSSTSRAGASVARRWARLGSGLLAHRGPLHHVEDRGGAGRSTSRSGAMPNPELVEAEPTDELDGARPEHGQAHVVDHLALCCSRRRRRALAPSARGGDRVRGNGTSVIGRT